MSWSNVPRCCCSAPVAEIRPQKAALTEEARRLFTEAQQVFTSAEQKFADTSSNFPSRARKQAPSQTDARQEARIDFAAGAGCSPPKRSTNRQRPIRPTRPSAKKLLGSGRDQVRRAARKISHAVARAAGHHITGALLSRSGRLRNGPWRHSPKFFPSPTSQRRELRRLKAHALHLAMQAWTSDAEKNYETAAQKGPGVARQAGPRQSTRARPIGWRFATSRRVALQKHADIAGNKEDDRKRAGAARRAEASQGGRRHSRANIKTQAKQLFQELAGTADGEEKPPANFAEAYELAKESLEVDAGQAGADQNRRFDVNDQANVPTYEKESQEAREKARELFRAGPRSARSFDCGRTTSTTRATTCATSRIRPRDYFDAAVLGEFLAKRHPTSSGARQGGENRAVVAFAVLQRRGARRSRQRKAAHGKPGRLYHPPLCRRGRSRRSVDDADGRRHERARRRSSAGLSGQDSRAVAAPRRSRVEGRAKALDRGACGRAQPDESRVRRRPRSTRCGPGRKRRLARGVERITKSADAVGRELHDGGRGAFSVANLPRNQSRGRRRQAARRSEASALWRWSRRRARSPPKGPLPPKRARRHCGRTSRRSSSTKPKR